MCEPTWSEVCECLRATPVVLGEVWVVEIQTVLVIVGYRLVGCYSNAVPLDCDGCGCGCGGIV